ncbi:SPOR domain-containing protein [Pseudodesulfovibrio sp.]|nr:SPOR domain-containing protein [Pseudodesulfovibrio sp.]
MKTRSLTTMLSVLAIAAMMTLVLAGCGRKHIVSSPPAQKPAGGVAPAPKPAVVDEKPTVLEDTYVVDAPDEETAQGAPVQEGDLADEQVAPEQSMEAEQAETAPEPVPMADMYYVQVGAFSDLENANNVLAGLLNDGYKGSRLIKTDADLFKVQAGAFPDKGAAEEALMQIQTTYPEGFILK